MKATPWLMTGTLLLMSCSTTGNTATQAPAGPAADEAEPAFCSRWIAGSEARALVEDGAVLLDVRTDDEFSAGHVDGAKNIPVDDLNQRLTELPRESPIVVYCGSGRRAHRAAVQLESAGYTVKEVGTQAQYRGETPAGCSGKDN